MNERKAGRGRLQLLLIAAVFIGPLIVATWMYRSGALTPDGRSNHGELLEPVTNLQDAAAGSPVLELAEGRWIMLYANEGTCGDQCLEALYRMRQTRQMVGREMDRLLRVFLHGDSAPDRVLLEGEHPGLITITDKGLASLLDAKRPGDASPGGIYLIDPLSNLVMYFPPDLDPREMVDDMKHLLKLSQIG
jgi:hypothetical protein